MANYESIIYHVRTLSLLRFFDKGASTAQILNYFHPILIFSVMQILSQIDQKNSKKNPMLNTHLQNMILNIFLELKIFNRESFDEILEKVKIPENLKNDEQLTKPEFLYNTIADFELKTLEKVISRKEKIRQNFKKSQKKSNENFNIEDIISKNNLEYQTEYFVDIFPVDVFIPEPNKNENFENFDQKPSDPLLIEIQGDQHFDQVTGKLDLRTERKLEILKT